MTHFLDETGNIPKQIPKEAKELAGFFALVIDETTKKISTSLKSTGIRCFEKNCDGMIRSELLDAKDEIHWKCSRCQNEGRISGWQGTKWHNR